MVFPGLYMLDPRGRYKNACKMHGEDRRLRQYIHKGSYRGEDLINEKSNRIKNVTFSLIHGVSGERTKRFW